eukprot:Hpha_TRINITY_DN15094_c1_g4::TRINITY_DN15094_c1_g4_i1::g.123738::m.123738
MINYSLFPDSGSDSEDFYFEDPDEFGTGIFDGDKDDFEGIFDEEIRRPPGWPQLTPEDRSMEVMRDGTFGKWKEQAYILSLKSAGAIGVEAFAIGIPPGTWVEARQAGGGVVRLRVCRWQYVSYWLEGPAWPGVTREVAEKEENEEKRWYVPVVDPREGVGKAVPAEWLSSKVMQQGQDEWGRSVDELWKGESWVFEAQQSAVRRNEGYLAGAAAPNEERAGTEQEASKPATPPIAAAPLAAAPAAEASGGEALGAGAEEAGEAAKAPTEEEACERVAKARKHNAITSSDKALLLTWPGDVRNDDIRDALERGAAGDKSWQSRASYKMERGRVGAECTNEVAFIFLGVSPELEGKVKASLRHEGVTVEPLPPGTPKRYPFMSSVKTKSKKGGSKKPSSRPKLREGMERCLEKMRETMEEFGEVRFFAVDFEAICLPAKLTNREYGKTVVHQLLNRQTGIDLPLEIGVCHNSVSLSDGDWKRWWTSELIDPGSLDSESLSSDVSKEVFFHNSLVLRMTHGIPALGMMGSDTQVQPLGDDLDGPSCDYWGILHSLYRKREWKRTDLFISKGLNVEEGCLRWLMDRIEDQRREEGKAFVAPWEACEFICCRQRLVKRDVPEQACDVCNQKTTVVWRCPVKHLDDSGEDQTLERCQRCWEKRQEPILLVEAERDFLAAVHHIAAERKPAAEPPLDLEQERRPVPQSVLIGTEGEEEEEESLEAAESSVYDFSSDGDEGEDIEAEEEVRRIVGLRQYNWMTKAEVEQAVGPEQVDEVWRKAELGVARDCTGGVPLTQDEAEKLLLMTKDGKANWVGLPGLSLFFNAREVREDFVRDGARNPDEALKPIRQLKDDSFRHFVRSVEQSFNTCRGRRRFCCRFHQRARLPFLNAFHGIGQVDQFRGQVSRVHCAEADAVALATALRRVVEVAL